MSSLVECRVRVSSSVECRVRCSVEFGVVSSSVSISVASSIAFKQENALIQVVTIVDGNVSVNRLGSPDLGWDVDDKQVSHR